MLLVAVGVGGHEAEVAAAAAAGEEEVVVVVITAAITKVEVVEVL